MSREKPKLAPDQFRQKLLADCEAKNAPPPAPANTGPRPLSHVTGFVLVMLEDLKAKDKPTVKIRGLMGILIKEGLADKLEYTHVRDLLRDDLGLIEIIKFPTMSQMPSVLPVIEDGKVVSKAGYRTKPMVLSGDSDETQLGGPFVPYVATPMATKRLGAPVAANKGDAVAANNCGGDAELKQLMDDLEPMVPDPYFKDAKPAEWKVDDYVPRPGS
jgi:hypothetical protein